MLSITKLFQAAKSVLNPRLAVSCQFHTSNPLSATLEEKLGLPARPKKPLTPYFRFLKENREKISRENPDKKMVEIIQLCAKQYANIDPALKAKYQDQYLLEQEDYIKKRTAYESKLTDEQRLEISNAKHDAVEKKLRIEYKRKLREHEKPKKPQSGFLRFLKDSIEKVPRNANQSYRDWQKVIAEKWNSLTEDQKKAYNDAATSEFQKYKQEIAKWELRMIRQGNIDLVREETLIEHENTSKPRLRSRKTRSGASSDSD